MQVKKQQLELEMEQWTGSKLGKEYIKAVYCHCAYLTYMHNGGVICISEVIDISPHSLDPACDSSSPAFLMMCSACKLNKQGDKIQP